MIIGDKEIRIKINGKFYHCALDITMDYIGGKWKSVILWYLIEKPLRFGELKKLIPDITEKMLSVQLKTLEKYKIVKRKAYASVPPKVVYSYTKDGKDLIPVVKALAKWGRKQGKKYGKIQIKKIK